MRTLLALLALPLYGQLPGINLPPPDPDPTTAEIPVIQHPYHANASPSSPVPTVAGFHEVMRGYVCEESIDRFRGETALDTITAIVSFEYGQEDYRQIKRNGRAIRAIHGLAGAWTEADFGTITENPDAEWLLQVDGREYRPAYLVSERAGGVVVRETLGFGLPAGILKVSWGIKHRPDGVPVNGWYQVSYNDGSYLRNQMYWDHCKVYGSESKVTFQ